MFLKKQGGDEINFQRANKCLICVNIYDRIGDYCHMT